MKVLVDDYKLIDGKKIKVGRVAVDAALVLDRGTTLVVRLPDGNVITRKKKRDLPGGDA